MRQLPFYMPTVMGENFESESSDSGLGSFMGSQQLELLDHASDAIILRDLDGHILYWNKGAQSLYGWTPEFVLHREINHLLKSRFSTPLEEITIHLLEKGSWSGEIEHTNRNGKMIQVSSRWTLRLNERTGSFLVMEVNSDMSSQRRYQRALIHAKGKAERASRAKAEFLSNISHEIRTPMNAILGFTELLLNEEFSREDQKAYLTRIKSSGDHLLNLIDDLLDISQLESGSVHLDTVAVPLLSVVKEVLEAFDPLAALKGLELKMSFHGMVPQSISSDPSRLKQILSNLLSNSIKFTDQGQIELRVGVQDNFLRFEVEDTGVGIKEKDLPKLFQPFSRVDGSMRRKLGGTGLGLNLSRRLAQAMGGDLVLQWSEVGRGSCFSFSIDISKLEVIPEATGLERLPVSEVRPKLKDFHVLLAEDCLDNEILIKTYLSKEDVEIDVAHNGREAVQMAQKRAYDLILMDVQMPGLDGLSATRQLRAKGLQLPILALTAHALPEEVDRSMAAGCDAHLTKPIRRDVLINKMLEYARPH